MEELFEWFDRMAILAPDAQPTRRMKRVASPPTLPFDGSVIRVDHGGGDAYPFGALPAQLSVLVWLDTVDNALVEHAVATQLGAVLTLATGRKVQVAAGDVAVDVGLPGQYLFLPTGALPDRSLCGPIEGDVRNSFEELLARLVGLPEDDRKAIGNATGLHYAAVLLYEVDLNAAYALLVAGIETLASRYGNGPVDWESWDRARGFDSVFEEFGLDASQTSRLRQEILKGVSRLAQGFADYVIETLGTDFWTLEVEDFAPAAEAGANARLTGVTRLDPIPMERLVPSSQPQLRRRLQASYVARSSYVHAGSGRLNLGSAIKDATGGTLDTDPIGFAGLRAILRELIRAEMDARSSPAELPHLELFADGLPESPEVPGES